MSGARLESRSVHAPRRLSILLASGLVALAVAPAAPALAEHARDSPDGDRQTASTAGGPTRTMPSLTDRPRRASPGHSGSSGSSRSDADISHSPLRGATGGSGPSPAAWGASGTTATQLPYTGADTRVVGLLGLALVLLGIGLRLRVADVRR